MLKILQEESKIWREKNFGDAPSWHHLLGVMEEVGELSHAHLKQVQGVRTNEDHLENKKDSIADIIIYLAGYCNAENIDMETILEETWNKVKQRDWKKFPENGLTS